MNNLSRRTVAAMMSLLLAAAPVAALAGETAPLSLRTQAEAVSRREDMGQLSPFGTRRAYLGVTASDAWLLQARIGGLMLNLRLFTPAGEGVSFQEKLCEASTGGKDIRLCIRQGTRDGGLLLQLDQRAVDVMKRVNITQIVVADFDLYIQAVYEVADLSAMRDALALGAGEQLCISGADNPITVVSEDGVRRHVAE